MFQRCPECGVTLWSNYAGAGESVHFVRTGTLDDPSIAPPDIHIYTSTKRPWVILPDGVPAVAEFYKLSDYWPAEGIERFKAARSKASALVALRAAASAWMAARSRSPAPR